MTGTTRPQTFYLIAHNIRSLYNVGSFFRTADAFGVEKIFLTGYTGTPKNPRLGKTALGAEKIVPWEYNKRLKTVLDKLKRKKVSIIALENNVAGTIPLNKFKPEFPLALLLGEEVSGIKKNHLNSCDKIVEIPMRGKKESLNVAVALGIAAYYVKLKPKS